MVLEMIQVRVTKTDRVITDIQILGHAFYDDYGKDIVCASVSATVICTVNGILHIDSNVIDVIQQEDLLEIVVHQYDDTTQTLLKNMIECLESLEKQYPQNIKMLIKEE